MATEYFYTDEGTGKGNDPYFVYVRRGSQGAYFTGLRYSSEQKAEKVVAFLISMDKPTKRVKPTMPLFAWIETDAPVTVGVESEDTTELKVVA